MRNPIIDAADDHLTPQEKQVEKALRPKGLTEFAGQEDIVENLFVFIQAAKQRGEALDHVLLHGPPGLGKTTLSHIIATELGANLRMTSGPVIEKPGDLAGLLTNLQEGDVLFIDEIHRLNTVVEEYLYSAMEDYRIDIMIDSAQVHDPCRSVSTFYVSWSHDKTWFDFSSDARTIRYQFSP